MLYAVFAVMLLAAVMMVAVPLYRHAGRIPTASAAGVVAAFLMAIALYNQIGMPEADSVAAGTLPDIDEMVTSLAERLEDNPDDLAGWKMLGRSYMQLKDFPAAISAFERAVELESGRNGQTLADLGEVILLSDGSTLNGRAGELFDNALAIAPGNQKALFYAGMAAVQRGDRDLGATHWETLLATSPPENIAAILREQIAELRGVPQTAGTTLTSTSTGGVVTASVSLGVAAAAAVQPDATVFIIARDPAQPSPPIAAVRRKVSELPAEVSIGDADAMIPGRVPSGFAELELVARVSISGQPMAQSGDWFGQQRVATSDALDVAIVIDQQVP